MLTDQWQGFTGLPDYTDPANIATYLKNLFDFLGSRAVPRYNTIADRDAELSSPANGQLAWVAADSTLYMRSGGAWVAAVRGTRPFVDVQATAVQSMTNGAETEMTYSAALENVGGMWNSGAPGRITATVPGVYQVSYTSSFGPAANTGSRIIVARKNGNTLRSFAPNLLAGATSEVYSFPVRLAAGDYISVNQYQSSGAAANTHTQSYPRLSAVLIG